jgi:hypothetical protein
MLIRPLTIACLLLLILLPHAVSAQTTAFNYQGKLADTGSPANGNYDFQFKLYDTATVGTGTQQGTTQTITSVAVTGGVFSVNLDFGVCSSCFNGADRFLEISVKPSSGSGLTVLSPRQPITSTPYAIKSLNSASADELSSSCAGCITSSQIGSVDGSVITGTVPVSTLPGSEAFIHNTTSPQSSSNFNISGNGVVAGSVAVGAPSPATRLDVVDSTSQIHFGSSTADNGGYLVSAAPSQANVAGGTRWSGSNWIAKSTEASVLGLANGNTTFYGNSGLTTGTAFSPTPRMTILNDGRVGIGTSLPSSSLEIAAQDGLSIAGFQPYLTMRDTASSNARSRIQGFAGHINLFPESFIGGTPAMIVRSGTGNVGIGTSTPSSKLEIAAQDGLAITGDEPFLTLRDTNFGYRSRIQGFNGDLNFFPESFIGGTPAVSVKSNSGNVVIASPPPPQTLGKLHVEGGNYVAIYGNTPTSTAVSGNSGSGIGVFGVSGSGVAVRGDSTSFTGVFGQTQGGEGVSGVSGLALGPGGTGVFGRGAVRGVWGYSPGGTGVFGDNENSNTDGYAGYFNGRVQITGNLTVNGTFINPSDARLKQQIKPIAYGLAEVRRLNPVTWKWNTDPHGSVQMGLVAQDVQGVLPELVQGGNDNEPLGLNYIGLLPVAIRAIQEQQTEIEDQKKQIDSQKEELAHLHLQIEVLTQLVCFEHKQSDVCR